MNISFEKYGVHTTLDANDSDTICNEISNIRQQIEDDVGPIDNTCVDMVINFDTTDYPKTTI